MRNYFRFLNWFRYSHVKLLNCHGRCYELSFLQDRASFELLDARFRLDCVLRPSECTICPFRRKALRFPCVNNEGRSTRSVFVTVLMGGSSVNIHIRPTHDFRRLEGYCPMVLRPLKVWPCLMFLGIAARGDGLYRAAH